MLFSLDGLPEDEGWDDPQKEHEESIDLVLSYQLVVDEYPLCNGLRNGRRTSRHIQE